MRREMSLWIVLGCLIALIVACYGSALFAGRQFGYRDAGHYYYPLYERVQKEWREGRWPPLWEPEENGGMPLLGNPTAAVLYPGKLIYACFPYPWAARLYVVAHTLLAFVTTFALMRSWGTSRAGSAISALSYAFGAPILFQYCNIIYLVGAAWLPLGLRAADRWLRLGRRMALLELSLVLAMETLGGDPEVSYVTGLCAGGYALALAWLRGRRGQPPLRIWPLVFAGAVCAFLWTAATLGLAARLPSMRPELGKLPPRAFRWMPWVPGTVLACWGVIAIVVLIRWRRQRWRSVFATMIVGLIGSAVLAGALAGAQLLPILEFTGQSGRAAGEGTHDIYPFSLEPTRVVELLWPNVFGTTFAYNRSWLPLVSPVAGNAKVWVPSLYVGGFTFVLALGAAGFRHGPPWRGWLTAIALLSLLISMGEYTSPIWCARFFPEGARALGEHDTPLVASIRHDGMLRDGDGGLYWTLATILPGFKQFRFPSKLLTFTALAFAGLAGLGWDRVREGQSGRTLAITALTACLTIALLIAVIVLRARILGAFHAASSTAQSAFGPFDVPGAFAELWRSLAHAAVVLVIGFALILRAQRWPALTAVAALGLVATDLGVANARYVLTVPQALLETTPRVVQLIEEAERAHPSPGPYRVHRTKIWNPMSWTTESSPDRVRDFVVWERETIQPKYGLSFGVHYTTTLGVAELYDYEWFFGPFLMTLKPDAAKMLGAEAGRKVVVYPRRGFDLWNTRYFVLPAHPGDWTDEDRGYASFLPESEAVYPKPEAFHGPEGAKAREQWVRTQDYQIRRNHAAFPRAWVVHSARFLKPIRGLSREEREGPVQEMLYDDDPFWSDPRRIPYNPRLLAWLGSEDAEPLRAYLPGPAPGLSEPVTVTNYQSERVELEANLERPGLVILADVYYPGWRLTIDGVPAPVYRANRMMRAAAVTSGKHHLVFTYEPQSFRVGGALSIAAMVAWLTLAIWFVRRPVTTSLSPGVFEHVAETALGARLRSHPLREEARVVE